MSAEDLQAEVERAERALADQTVQLAELRARASPDAAGGSLLAVTAAAGGDAGNGAHQELLDLIVRTATTVLDAEAASLFIVDSDAEELVFQVATGPGGAMLQGQRIPLGTGIVGYVAATGSPLTVNSVRDDPRFAASFAQSVGYMPENILATPLVDRGDVIGVLEVLNKKRGVEGFGQRDIEVLGMFANQAAVAWRRSIASGSMLSALESSLRADAGENSPGSGSDLNRFALRISDLVREIGGRGEGERRLLLSIVEAVHAYLEERDRPSG